MKKADDSVLKIELLRPHEWVVSHNAYAGTTIHLDLEEMGASGPAKVVNIGRAPPLAKGPGQIVTGTFSHSAGNVINLYVAGLDQPIGTTDNHPFWSEDRQAFIPAGELQSGEHLRTENGNLLAVTASSPRVADAVFNLEVNTEHVYFVSSDAVLVHNSYKHVDGGIASVDEALDGAETFLGPGYNSLANGRYVSADGMRQVRLGTHELKDPLQQHIHFEAYDVPADLGGHIIESTFTLLQ